MKRCFSRDYCRQFEEEMSSVRVDVDVRDTIGLNQLGLVRVKWKSSNFLQRLWQRFLLHVFSERLVKVLIRHTERYRRKNDLLEVENKEIRQ